MIAKTIKLFNFRSFKGLHEFKFDSVNLITGPIGKGKSSLGRIAFTFLFYGYSDVPNSKLPNKYVKGEKTWVEGMIQDKGDTIVIKREIPTKVTIHLNGVEVLQQAEGAPNNKEKNEWIEKRFGTLDYFKKFRMIDITDGINVLEAGSVTLRKTLISFHEEFLNKIRQNLLDKKNLYEKFNKDSAGIYKHYPSMKRIEFFQSKYKELGLKINEINQDVYQFRSKCNTHMSERGSLESTIRYYTEQGRKAKNEKNCPTCNKALDIEQRKAVYQEAINQIRKANELMVEVNANIKKQQSNVEFFQTELNSTIKKQQKLNELKLKMEGRLKQKNFKYTNRDVLLVSSSIKELDKFYSYYILESVKNLEPIINSILVRIGFVVKFSLNEKGDFNLVVFKDSEEFTYKELSSGQRLMLSIAFQLALLLDKGETGLILADEGFNNLDAESVDALYEMFKELPFQLISILHRYSGQDNRNLNVINLNEVLNGK